VSARPPPDVTAANCASQPEEGTPAPRLTSIWFERPPAGETRERLLLELVDDRGCLFAVLVDAHDLQELQERAAYASVSLPSGTGATAESADALRDRDAQLRAAFQHAPLITEAHRAPPLATEDLSADEHALAAATARMLIARTSWEGSAVALLTELGLLQDSITPRQLFAKFKKITPHLERAFGVAVGWEMPSCRVFLQRTFAARVIAVVRDAQAQGLLS
jgi:hypothetical protein